MHTLNSKIHPVRRDAGNPITTAGMLPFSCRGVFNSSVSRLPEIALGR